MTVEPCIMCAYALHISKVSRVVYGCDNDKFGGTGGILSLNKFEETGDGGMPYPITKGIC